MKLNDKYEMVFKDLYNPLKEYVIRRTKCGHFLVNQKINGKLVYNKFIRMKKSTIVNNLMIPKEMI